MLKKVSSVFKENFIKSFKGVSRKFQGCFKEILRMFQDISKRFHVCFKNVSIKLCFAILLLHVKHRSYPSRRRACYTFSIVQTHVLQNYQAEIQTWNFLVFRVIWQKLPGYWKLLSKVLVPCGAFKCIFFQFENNFALGFKLCEYLQSIYNNTKKHLTSWGWAVPSSS